MEKITAKHEYILKVKDRIDHKDRVFAATSEQLVVPRTIDLRSQCSPIEDQGDLGACTGHAIVGALEYLENIQHEHFIRLSREFVYYNERVLEGTVRSDAGASIKDGIQVIATYGACEETLWPYDVSRFRQKPSEQAYEDALKRRALAYAAVDQTKEAITQCLALRKPIVFGIMVYDSFESDETASTGLVPMPAVTEKCLGGHAVMMAGYDLDTDRVLVRNSWGKDWGIQGYFWLPFDYVLSPALSDSFWTVSKIE